MQTLYDPKKNYIMQVHMNVPAMNEIQVIDIRGIPGEQVPACQAKAYTNGILIKISETMIQAFSPLQIKTILFIIQQ
jgi:hypothetical protein